MWISERAYNRLIERIEDLEQCLRVTGRVSFMDFTEHVTGHCSPPLGKRWHAWLSGDPSNNITVEELVCRMATHLGFTLSEASAPKLVDPPKLWLDIHNQTQEPEAAARIKKRGK